jgi:bacterioferritin
MDKERSIDLLNKAVGDEIQALHQYMYFHFHAEDQGFGPISALFKRVAIAEMMHAEDLAERILFLGGDVTMAPSGPVETISDVESMLKWAADAEAKAVTDYNAWANECSQHADAASRQVFEALIADEERHFDEFDQQLDNIARFGPSYLALQTFGSGSAEGAGGE